MSSIRWNQTLWSILVVAGVCLLPALPSRSQSTFSVRGTVWRDADNSANNTFNNIKTGNESGTNGGGLKAILVSANNTVIASTNVSNNGTYTFSGISAQNGLTIQLSTTAGTNGAAPPAASILTNWAGTSPLTTTSFNLSGSNITAKDFGIQQLPIATNVTGTTQINPGSNTRVQVVTLAGTDGEDGTLGANKKFRIKTLPINGTLYYNGIAITSSNYDITSYDPALLTLDPNDGSIDVTFTYTPVDNANMEDPTPGIVMMPFGIPNLTVTKTTLTPNAVPGGATSYSITVTNAANAGTAVNVQITDTLPAGFTFDANLENPTTSGGSTRTTNQNPAQNVSNPTWGTFTIPAGGSVTIKFAVNISETQGISTYQNQVSVTSTPGSANYDYNGSTGEDVTLSNFTPPPPSSIPNPPVVLGGICAIPGRDGPPPETLAGVVNSYYPGVISSVTAGSNSIEIGAATGTGLPIQKGDLLLLIQMQDATIDYTNTANYGSGNSTNLGSGQTSMGNSGLYEYVVATNNVLSSGGTLNIKGANNGGVTHTYINASATSSRGQRRFQIVRVPQYASLKLSNTLQAQPWNGQTGGIIALDVAGDLDFNSRIINIASLGFRGGYSPVKTSSGNSVTTYVSSSASLGGVKGEGIAGTPQYVWDGMNLTDNGANGYPSGDWGKGAPANAGGGGNSHNAGGGGGGNGGIGGQGGLPWRGMGGTIDAGGRPGFWSSTTAPVTWRLTMGGGGGSGDANNAIGVVRGGVGGGIALLRTGRILGTGTISATGGDGDVGTYSSAPDGAGGGGAGGTVVLLARNASPPGTSISVQANGGKGGNTLQDDNNEHGPGGGGGGGVVLYNVPGATISAVVNGGSAGRANNGAGRSHGAVAGSTGIQASFTNADDPLASVNNSDCFPSVTVNKTTTTPQTQVGATATYKIVIKNAPGKADANSVTVTDNLPSGFTYGTTTSIVSTNGATRTSNVDPSVGQTSPTWGSFTIPGGGQVEITFQINIGSSVANGTYQNSATVNYIDPTRATATDTSSVSYNSATSTSEDVLVKSPAKVRLIKRITRINGLTTNPNDGTVLGNVLDNNATPDDDPGINWPNLPGGFLLGAYDAGKIQPGDVIEYTVYFINSQGSSASSVKICDRIVGAQKFLNDGYGPGKDIEYQLGTNPVEYLTKESLTSIDRAELNPSTAAISGCPNPSGIATGANNGTVTIDVTGTNSEKQTDLNVLPAATSPGIPTNSYGYFRFKTKVDP
jgi:fimbrial isopeptide formation D2 family protein/uncharacterized repeat protein (TIGR01451 family)